MNLPTWNELKAAQKQREEALDTSLLEMFGVSQEEVPKIKEFALEFFPKRCDFYVDGRLSVGGIAVAKVGLEQKETTGQYAHACLKCRNNSCTAREKPYNGQA